MSAVSDRLTGLVRGDGRQARIQQSAASGHSMLVLFERGFTYIGVAFYLEGLASLFRDVVSGGTYKTGDSDPFSALFTLFTILFIGGLVLVRWQRYARIPKYVIPYICIVVLCYASVLWSDNPSGTIRRSTSMLACVLFGIYATETFGAHYMVVVLSRVAVAFALLSVVFYVALPSIGHETNEGYTNALRGIFPQKNVMGECMVLGTAAFAYRVVREHRLRLGYLGGIGLMIFCLLLGRTGTSMLSALLTLLVGYYLYFRDRRPMKWLMTAFLLWAVLCIVTILVVSPDLLSAATGRDASLTGRVPLWLDLIPQIGERPLLGHGFGGFWREDSNVVQWIWVDIGWKPPDAHSGYLDVMVQIGLVGFALYMWLTFRVFALARHAWRLTAMPIAAFALMFLALNITTNIDEGPLPSPDLFTCLLVGLLLELNQWREQDRLRLLAERWERRPALRLRLTPRPPRVPIAAR